MEILPLTRSRITKRVIVKDREDFEKLEIGDSTIIRSLGERSRWMVYEGTIKGKEAFIRQNPDNLTQIISYRERKDSILISGNSMLLTPSTREIEIYNIGNQEYCFKMGLLMTAGLWRNLADLQRNSAGIDSRVI